MSVFHPFLLLRVSGSFPPIADIRSGVLVAMLIQMMERSARARYLGRMRRVAELERLAQVARQQARITTNRETSEALLEIACEFATAANDRRVALEAKRRQSLVTTEERGA